MHSCSILSAEFMRASMHDAGDMDAVILSKSKTRATLLTNGKDDEVSMNAICLTFLFSSSLCYVVDFGGSAVMLVNLNLYFNK